MSVDISCAHRNYCETRMHCGKQCGGRAARTAVMRNFQQHRLGMRFDDTPFGRTFRVTLEQSGRPAKRGGKYETVVIRTHRTGDLIASRSEHVKVHSAVIELIALFFHRDCHTGELGLRNNRCQFAYRLIDAEPKFSRMKIRNHGWHSPKMIGVRMSDRDDVEAINVSIPEIRRDHLLAKVEVGMHPLRQASSIYQQGTAFGSHEKDGIALSDINRGHLHYSCAKTWPRGDKGNPASKRQ